MSNEKLRQNSPETKMLEKEPSKARLTATDLSISVGTRDLIVDGNFSIGTSERLALIGRNGSGKTSLLDLVAAVSTGDQPPEYLDVKGDISLTQAKVGYLRQDIQVAYDGTVKGYIDQCAQDVAAVIANYDALTARLADGETGDELMDEYGKALDEMSQLDAWDFPRKREMILQGLGLTADYLDRDMTEVSGGEATKVSLAGILVASPNLILLDEPTNNLDPESVKFFEEWVKTTQTSLLLVSHDREFLDETVTEILEIDEDTKHLIRFGGNYSFYKQKKQEMFDAQMRSYEEQQKKRKQLEDSAKQLKQEAQRFEGMSNDSFYRAKGGGLAKRAKSQLERIERELNDIPEPVLPKRPSFEVKEPQISDGTVMVAQDLSYRYPNNSVDTFSKVNFSIRGGERVGIVGANGAGKSTLLRVLIGNLPSTGGKVEQFKGLKVGYLPQTTDRLKPDQNIIDYIRRKASVSVEDAYKALSRMLLDDSAHKSVSDFSFGEFRRIELVALFASNPDVLVLDEPTNHLDIYTIETLEDALTRYHGTVITVTHDERFLKDLNIDKIIVVGKGGLVGMHKVEDSKDVAGYFT